MCVCVCVCLCVRESVCVYLSTGFEWRLSLVKRHEKDVRCEFLQAGRVWTLRVQASH